VTEIEGLKRKLTSKLGATVPALVPDWQVLFCFILSEYRMRGDARNGYGHWKHVYYY
jgi:hypothetical protein